MVIGRGSHAILENTVSQLSAVQQANFPNEAARVLAGNPVPPSFPGNTIPSAGRASGSEGTGFRTGTRERVMKAAAFRVGMSRLLPASLWSSVQRHFC